MPFDQSTITDILTSPRGADLAVSWSSTAPSGSCYQLYINRRLTWHGKSKSTVIPHPGAAIRVEVGVVLATEATRNFASSLPAVPGGGSKITVSWLGGRFLSPTIRGFHVYAGTTPGGGVNYGVVVGTVAAYAQNIINDGFGVGALGWGAFGASAGTYNWTSGPLASGTWNVAVRSFDAAGNEGPAIAWAVAVSGPPRPVARNVRGQRLTYSSRPGPSGGFGDGPIGEGSFGSGSPLGFGSGGMGTGSFGIAVNDGGRIISLAWLASPGA